MKIAKWNLMYFSPTESTTKIMETIGKQVEKTKVTYDLTDKPQKTVAYSFGADDFVCLGIPVYGGRVPKTVIERLEKLEGNQTPIALIVTYGNRAYEDALIELKTIVIEKGFCVVAGAAFVTEHSIVNDIAKGRPDKNDLNILSDFAKRLVRKVDNIVDIEKESDLFVKGNKAYREYKALPFKPYSTTDCLKCGICVDKCPTGAISKEDSTVVDSQLCISCMRCVRVCPNKARKLQDAEAALIKKSLFERCKEEKQPEIFINE